MAITGKAVEDALFEKLGKHIGQAEIVELTASIAIENLRSKFNAPLKVEAQGSCPLHST